MTKYSININVEICANTDKEAIEQAVLESFAINDRNDLRARVISVCKEKHRFIWEDVDFEGKLIEVESKLLENV